MAAFAGSMLLGNARSTAGASALESAEFAFEDLGFDRCSVLNPVRILVRSLVQIHLAPASPVRERRRLSSEWVHQDSPAQSACRRGRPQAGK